MKNILVLIFLFCSVVLNAATNVISRNSSDSDVEETYPDIYYTTSDLDNSTIPDNTIYYTTSDGNVCTPNASETLIFGANIVSNTYQNGQGIITFDGAVVRIWDSAFYERSTLTSIIIPNSVTYIGERAFRGCSGLTSITIPNSVTSIEHDTFYQCSGLTSINIPNSVTSIGNEAFCGCDGLTSIIIPSSVTSIGNMVIYGCDNLTSITIDVGNEHYDSRNNCNAIIETSSNTLIAGCKNTTIPNSVTSIGDGAFYFCSSLTSITIPTSVTNIGEDAFRGCSGLTSITSEATTPPACGDYCFNTVPSSAILRVPYGTSNAYKNANGWSRFSNIEEMEPEEVLCTSIALSSETGTLNVGDTKTLTATVSPSNASDKAIIWSSSNTAIATVSTSGLVTAKAPGTVTITATANDGSGVKATCSITVKQPVMSIQLSSVSELLNVGDTKALSATVSPSNASDKAITWSSSNTSIATVSASGLVTAVATGTAKITATTTDGTNLTATCIINVTNPVKSVTLSKYLVELETEESETIIASCTPSNADDISISWYSKNTNIATVTKGKIEAVSVGETEVVAKSVNGVEATCKVIVNPTIATSIELNKNSLNLIAGSSEKLEATILPIKTTNKTIKWESSNSNIISVDNSGIVKALSNGTARITASTTDGSNLSVACVVTVTTFATRISLNQNSASLTVGQSLSLVATILPSSTSNKNVTWQSNNSNCASVSTDGIVYANASGTAKITATTTDGTNLSASCDIIVKKAMQSIVWNNELPLLREGGEMIALEASSSSGLPVKFISSDDNVVSIFDLGDVVYANPVNSGKAYITSYQEGNYKYEPVESRKEIEVLENPVSTTKTLIAYYSQSVVIDGIVAELANQIASSNASVFTQKIEPTNDRINNANSNSEVRDSVMNVISLYPNDANSYPTIRVVNVNISDYDNVIMVYPLWNSLMAAPMQTFDFINKDILKKKSIAYVEYDLYGEAGPPANAKVLRFNSSNIDDKSNAIEDWLGNSEATGILQIRKDKISTSKGVYDLQGRKLSSTGEHGLYIIKGRKIIK